jgi:catechol 2,3-dioxygenase-like lactoylglutathione lyase family enzyme
MSMQARLDQIGIVVEDMGRALAFYRELGLEVPADADKEGHVEVTLRGGLRLAWDSVEVIRSFEPDWQPPSGGQRIVLAFRLDSPADVDKAYAHLEQLGYPGHKAPWDAFWGQRYAQVADPDGNVVDLFAPLEGR